MALARVEAAAAEGTFVQLPDFVSKLFRWRGLIGDEGIERVRGWLAEQLVDDVIVVALARSFVSPGWTHAAGDVVAWRITHLNRGTVEALVDPDAFRARVAELLTNADLDADRRGALEAFEAAWARSGRGAFGD